MNSSILLLFSLLALTSAAVPQSRIVGGTTATVGQYPFSVSVQTLQYRHQCGGAIINNRWILSAAHCVVNRTAASYVARVGTNVYNQGGAVYGISKFVAHPAFNAAVRSYDVALIQTKTNIIYNAYTKSITLAKSIKPAGSAATTAGWGYLNSSPNAVYALSLQHLKGSTVNADVCRQRHSATGLASLVGDNTFCVEMPKNTGVCDGDSGNPLFVGGELVGLLSWTSKCASDAPEVYTQVFSYTYWINQTMKP